MGEIRTSVAIKAAPSDVWDVLMDFDSYHEWNPFIRSIEGSPVKGASIEVLLGASGKKPMKFSPVVQESNSPSRFAWLGSFGFKGVFDGHHQFELEEVAEGTLFHQYEDFSGILAPIALPALRKATTRGFTEMNQALKIRAEAPA